MKYRSIGWIAINILLTSCGDDPLSDVKNFVAEVRSRPPEPIKGLPEIKQVESFIYQAEINNVPRRDPFERTDKVKTSTETVKTSGGVPPPNPLRRKEHLEQYELDALKMVGTICFNENDKPTEQTRQKSCDVCVAVPCKEMWALLLTPDGLFKVKAGNYVGKNHGQINRVTEDKVELTEIVADEAEGWKERQAAIGIEVKE